MTSDETIKKLIEKAYQMRLKAYTPYSQYKVGAAILDDQNNIYSGKSFQAKRMIINLNNVRI